MNRAMFVTIEGGEGSGKSTVVKGLRDYLFHAGIPTTITREPGGNQVCEEIRSTILNNNICTWTEALLFLAARKEHYETVIKPAMKDGHLVICDRYMDSTLVYQSYVGDIPRKKLLDMHRAIDVAIPDLTIVLDIDPKVGLNRISMNHREVNRIDLKGIAFHERVRDGFLKLAEENKGRIVVVDASGNTEKTLQKVIDVIRCNMISYQKGQKYEI